MAVTKKLYRRGAKITDPHMLLSMLIDGRTVYWNHKPQNAAFMISMQLYALIRACRRGIVYEAIRTESGTSNDN